MRSDLKSASNLILGRFIRAWVIPVFLTMASSAMAADSVYSQNERPEWQWSVPIKKPFAEKTSYTRAYLWIPPRCERLRGVVVGQQNLEEEQLFEHPAFRKALADLNFAVVWVTPQYDLFFRFDRGSGDTFDGMLKALADESGYDELPLVPIVPIGHSAAASSPWNFSVWAPERTLAAISVSGQWAYYRDKNTPDFGERTVGNVPGLVTMGEYEGAFDRAATGLKERADHPQLPLTMLAESAGEHFAASDLKVAFIADYLRKAAQFRLPADWPIDQRPKLNDIDPTKAGWLVDRARPDGKPTAPAAPVAEYKGDPKDAFWAFDSDLAKQIESIASMYAGKELQLLGYVQKDGIVPQRKAHVRVGLKPAIGNDDLTYKLGSTFLDTAPEDWRGLKAGQTVTHAANTSNLLIIRTCGPVEKIGPDTFALRFERGTLDDPNASAAMCFLLSHPGDETHKPMALEAEMKVPCTNRDGEPQQISEIDLPASVKVGTKSLALSAKSSAGLPVFFYVREGPAVLNGNTLQFTEIPPRAKFPVTVTVVAWQWGRNWEPKVQSAAPVERTILVDR